MKRVREIFGASLGAPFPAVLVALAAITSADGGGGPGSLKRVQVPLPGNLNTFVKDRAAAIRLGKALFWEEQTGGDGRIACATCHFHAGADNRVVNTLHPGPDGIFDSGGVRGPGQRFTPANIVNDDRVGSQGIASSKFVEDR